MVRRRAALAMTAASALGLAACTAVLGMDKLSERASGPDPDPDATDAGDGGPRACTDDAIDAAARPSPQGPGDQTRYFAIRELELAVGGYDLDHVRTTEPTTSSCTFPEGVTPIMDGPDGVDNAGASLFPTVGIVAPALSTTAVNDRLRDGQFGVVLGLGGWNGTPTDDSLTLLLFPTLGIWTVNGDGTKVPGGPTNPAHAKIVGDGSPGDLWMRDARFPTGGAGTAVAAWVNQGRLVARFDTLTLPIRSDHDLKLIDIVVHDAWITADLGGDADQPTLTNGVLAGRFDVPEFLSGLLELYTGQDYLCHQGQFPELARARVCAYRDIRTSHCDDGQAKPCDAISIGARFHTYRVEQLGPLFEQSESLYASAGLLVPEARCVDVDVDAGSRCAP